MSPAEVAAMLVRLRDVFGGWETSPDGLRAWHDALKAEPAATVHARLAAWERERHHRPTPADLLGVPRESKSAEPAAPSIAGTTCREPMCSAPRAPGVHVCAEHLKGLVP